MIWAMLLMGRLDWLICLSWPYCIWLGNGPHVLGNGPHVLGNGPHVLRNGPHVGIKTFKIM